MAFEAGTEAWLNLGTAMQNDLTIAGTVQTLLGGRDVRGFDVGESCYGEHGGGQGGEPKAILL